jgi:hypothetical protein
VVRVTSSLLRGAVAALAVVLLAACSGSDDASPETSATPSTTASAAPLEDSAACSFLTPEERQRLAGVAVDTVVASSPFTAGSGQCRWQDTSALVQVTTLPAKEWAKSLPDVVAQLESSSELSSAADQEDLDRAKKLLAGAASFTDAQACEAFVTLAELGGEKKGSTTTVTTVPITDTESGISAQTCTDGELTSIIYSVPGLKQSAAVDRTVTDVLTSAQERVAAATS